MIIDPIKFLPPANSGAMEVGNCPAASVFKRRHMV